MPVSKLDIGQFAQKIKEKYPDYRDMNDTLLTQKVLEKHPEYKDMVDLGGVGQPTPVDQGSAQTTDKVNQPIQPNGTFQPDLEGEKKGLYLNDPDYQKQKTDFVGKILTDDKGNKVYPLQDDKGNWYNDWTKQPIQNFNPHSMNGKILEVPHEQLPATNGKQFITPILNPQTGSYDFPDVKTPDVPHEQDLPEATVYGPKRGAPKDISYSPQINSMVQESKKQGGQLGNVLANNPELGPMIDNGLKKYGPEYKASLMNGSPAMMNVIQKGIEDKYDLNSQLPTNVDQNILNGHLNILNAFDENRANFENQQKELQRQADLMQDKAKRTGVPLAQDDMDRLNQKQKQNIDNWNSYKNAVNFAQNYVNQPEVKDYLGKFQQKQHGLKVLDEVRQRSFPDDTDAAVKQDEYNRKGIEGNQTVWDYLKNFGGRAASVLSNVGETASKFAGMPEQLAEAINQKSQDWIKDKLPQLSPEAIEEMSKGKHGIALWLNDLSGTLGSLAPYAMPGLAEEGLGAKAATFATALASSIPEAKQQALDAGLTGKSLSTFTTVKPLLDAAFMSLLPSGKIAKGFEGDVAKAIENGEYNNPRSFLMNMATKAFEDKNDIAHLQAMLSGTNLGDAMVNKLTNSLQTAEDAKRGIKRSGDPMSVDLSNVFNPKQTATMAVAAKIMESVPTVMHGVADYKTLKDVGKVYDNARNNMVELAANDLQGATKKVDDILKKDPSNIYAQHIKTTLQDFADAKSKMPDGLSPEQQTALFDIQRKVSQNDRQSQTADATYKPHIEKNTEALKKQIQEIIDKPEAAIKYLQPAHDDLVNNIQSPKTDENEKTEANAQAEGRNEIANPEGAENTTEMGVGAAPSIQTDANYRTLNYGNNKGKDETPEAKEKIKNEILEDKKIGGNGEKFSDLLNRVIPTFKNSLDNDPHNTAIVTHSSVIKALQVWEKMGRPDIAEIKADKLKEFAQKYVDLQPEAEGKVHTFKGDNGNDIKVIRHGETEDNVASEFREDNTQLTDKGKAQAERAGNNLIKETGGKVPKIISSDLDRTVHTSEIIHQKLKDNALQIGQPETLGTHDNGTKSAGGTSESSGMGSGQQGNEPSGESGQSGPPSEEKQEDTGKEKKPVENDLPFIEEEGDNDFTSTKNAITKQKIEDAGLDHPMKEAAREFGAVWKEAQDKLAGKGKAKPYDIEKLINELDKKPRAVTDTENAMILFHQNVLESQLDAANRELDQARKEGDRNAWNEAYDTRGRILDDLQKVYNVDKAIGTATARGLNARKMMVDRRFSLVNMQLEKRASSGGEPLTDAQTAEVQKQYEAIKKAKDALDARVSDLQKENAKLTADLEVAKQAKAAGGTRKTSSQFKQDRKEIVQKMRDDLLKAAKGGEGLTSSIPLAAQLKAIAPHIKDLVKSFIDEGVDKLEDITKGIKALLSPSIPEIEDRHIHDLIAGAYNEPKAKAEGQPSKESQIKEEAKVQKYRATDPKLMKAQADYENAKEAFEQGLKKDQLKTRTTLQKTQDAFLKYERFAKLSNPITLGKLAMAAITRIATTPLEEGVGAAYSAALPGIAGKAPGEAGFHVKALAKGYKAAFMRGLDDAATVAKGGKTDIEAVYGKKGHLPPEAIDFFGQLHSAIKAPVKRFAFERSFEKRMANNIKNGTPIDGITEARIAMEAYKDSQRSIFMQDNAVSKGWSNLISSLERSDTPGSKELATGMQWLIPFVKVPTNIVGETISHVAGPEIALAKILHTGLTKGLSNLSQDEAEMVMRNLKKGTIGHGALVLGYLNPQAFGGYYQNKEKRKPGDVKPGDLRLFGHTVPAWALEAPIFQAMQIGATVRRVKDTMVKGEAKGIGEGVWAGALGLMSHEPLIDEPSRLGGMLASDKERQYFLGELTKSTLIPAASDYAAKVTDPLDKASLGRRIIEPENDRQPTTIKEHVESAIPGLREDVGEKKPTGGGHRQRQHR